MSPMRAALVVASTAPSPIFQHHQALIFRSWLVPAALVFQAVKTLGAMERRLHSMAPHWSRAADMVGYKEVHKVVMEVQEPLPISTVVLVAMVQIPAAVVVAVQEVRWAREEMVATVTQVAAVASAAEEVAEMAAAQAHQTWGLARVLVQTVGTTLRPREEERKVAPPDRRYRWRWWWRGRQWRLERRSRRKRD